MQVSSIGAWWRSRPWFEKVAAIALAALLLAYGAGLRSGSLLTLLEWLAIVSGGLVAIRYLRIWLRALMWRLRHRLLVTYIFIGVVPVLLLLLMAGLAASFFYGSVATYMVDRSVTRVQEEMLMAASATAHDLTSAAGDPDKLLRANLPRDLAEIPFEVATVRERPPWLKEEFHGVVEAYGGPSFRTAVLNGCSVSSGAPGTVCGPQPHG